MSEIGRYITYVETAIECFEKKLHESYKAKHEDAPIGFSYEEALIWHSARACAFQYVLEMLPEKDFLDERLK